MNPGPYRPASGPVVPSCILKQGPLKLRTGGSAGVPHPGGGGHSGGRPALHALAAAFSRAWVVKHVILAHPRTVADIHAIYQCMVSNVDPSRITDAKAIGFLGNIGFASIKATPLLIVLAPDYAGAAGHGHVGVSPAGGGHGAGGSFLGRGLEDPQFVHFTDIRALYDEMQLECACNFAFLAEREMRFACASSVEYLDWMKCVRRALELACASPSMLLQDATDLGTSTRPSSVVPSTTSSMPELPSPEHLVPTFTRRASLGGMTGSSVSRPPPPHGSGAGGAGGGASTPVSKVASPRNAPVPPSPSGKRYILERGGRKGSTIMSATSPGPADPATLNSSGLRPAPSSGYLDPRDSYLVSESVGDVDLDTNSIQQDSELRVRHPFRPA